MVLEEGQVLSGHGQLVGVILGQGVVMVRQGQTVEDLRRPQAGLNVTAQLLHVGPGGEVAGPVRREPTAEDVAENKKKCTSSVSEK